MKEITIMFEPDSSRPNPTFLGRNGSFVCKGLNIVYGDNFIDIYPITSKGNDGRCRIPIPYASLHGLIKCLVQLIPESEGICVQINSVRFPSDKEEDLLITAIEGGSNYWYLLKIAGIDLFADDKKEFEHLAFSEKLYQSILLGQTIEVFDVENPDEKLGELSLKTILKGSRIMLEDFPSHYNDVLEDNMDANTADVWLQCCVLGEVMFG
jgi:hypothetical protein